MSQVRIPGWWVVLICGAIVARADRVASQTPTPAPSLTPAPTAAADPVEHASPIYGERCGR